MRTPLDSRALKCLYTMIFVLAATGVSRAQPPLDIDRFVVPGDGANVWRLTPGPDGAIWFTLTRCAGVKRTFVQHPAMPMVNMSRASTIRRTSSTEPGSSSRSGRRTS
jgi:hypothetical protein